MERLVGMNDVLRYSSSASAVEAFLDDYLNFAFLTQAPGSTQPRVILESGINAVAEVVGPDGPRRPLIALRSSPWKVGQESTPWHDEFDLDHGHVRYFGDHKASTVGPVGSTRGNKWLLEAWRSHAAADAATRRLAPPLMLFRAVPVYRGGRRIDKGHVEFCGVGIIERLEYLVQRDPGTGTTFPNLVIDIDVVRLDRDDELDWRWLDDRRDASLTAEESMRHAPESWRRWVREGRAALPRVRRRVVSSRVLKNRDQLPDPGSKQEQILHEVYGAFDGHKHAFEMLAARVAERILTDGGARYSAGWLTRAGGDGGMDFVGRLDVGSTVAKTPLVVLGQAKCVKPSTSISPDEVARLVARLRRGWVGVFVTTGTFSQQAQIEIVDDEYPVVLVSGRTLADAVFAIAEESFEGRVADVIAAAKSDYAGEVTHRRPHEILGAG